MKKHRELKGDESKIISGKSSIKTIFSKKSKEENAIEIKAQIESIESDVTRVSEIYDIMTVVLGYVEIDRFKVTFILTRLFFYKLILRYAQTEKEAVYF